MKLKVFAVRDSATAQYGTPMFLISEGQAIRSFSDEVNRNAENNQIFAHPDDFELFSLGSFDTDTAVMECVSPPVSLVTGKSVKIRS